MSSEHEYHVPGIKVIDRFFSCPVSYTRPHGEQLQVFVRECSRRDENGTASSAKKYLLFLQGGPGFECSSAVSSNSGMLGFLLRKGYTVLFLDQRGTGMSTPLTAETLELQGDLETQVEYCKQFRADSIVKDCEVIRCSLGVEKWTLLGQSFGGFVILTYLSIAPESLQACLITGGLAPINHDHPDPIYSRLIKKVVKRNEEFYRKYPGDIDAVKMIVKHLEQNKLQTPNGGDLTARRFLQIGLDLGMHGGIDRLHILVQKLKSDLKQFNLLTHKARAMVEDALHFDSNPIYALLHESIYCQSSKPSGWSSDRLFNNSPEFDYRRIDGQQAIYFTGENIFRWMFDDYAELRPLKHLAERLAEESWTPLYDLGRLKTNAVPIAASAYIEDMYLHCDLAIETLQLVGNTRDLVTNRWLHNAIRHAPEELLGYLLNLLDDLPVPS